MSVSAPPRDQLAFALGAGLILSVTVLQKFALPLGGRAVIYLGLPLLLGLLGLGAITRRLALDAKAASFLLLMMAGLTISQLVGGQEFSVTSLALLLVTHLAYAARSPAGLLEPQSMLRFYQQVCAALAALGIAQFGLQFIIGQSWAFFIDTKLPAALIVPGFNSLNELRYGSEVLKANGLFMLEPSHLSQFLALAVVIELVYFRHLLRLALLLAGIIVTFSGTGLVLLLLLTPFYLLQQRRFIVLGGGLVLLLTAGLWAPAVGLGPIYDRVFEFTNPQSSGYARFLGIFPTLRDHIVQDPSTLFFGKGAGSISAVVQDTGFDYMTHNPSWGKLFYEYGLLGLVAYLAFFFTMLARANVSVYLRAALALQFLFLSEYLLPPTLHGLIIALLVWPNPAKERPA